MMMPWNDYLTQIGDRVGEFGRLAPATVKAFGALDAAAAQGGHLDDKTRELIALAVAVTTRCDGCITVHTSNAIKAGATREEIAEALSVAIALNAGAALVYSMRVLDAHAAKTA